MKPEGSVLRVLHVIHGFGTGGAETWLYSAVKYISQHPELGMHFDFLATGGVKERFDEEILSLGSAIFYMPYSIRRARSFRQSFRKILREGKYDVVHDHQDFISGWHFLLGQGLLPKVRITHLHNPYNFVDNYVDGPGRFLSFRMGRWLTAWYATRITGTSDDVMNEYGYHKWPFRDKRVSPIYCGIDMQGFQYDKSKGLRIREDMGWQHESFKIALFVGRIGMQEEDRSRNQKNPAFALEVALRLVRQYASWRVLFVGYKGRAGEEMEGRVKEERLGDQIRFLGVRSDVPALMSAADVLLFPSIWEGLGMVAVEAQATGLRVAMSDTIPSESVVSPDLVIRLPLRKGPETWAAVIDEASKNAVPDRTSYNALATGSPFSIERSLANLRDLYFMNT